MCFYKKLHLYLDSTIKKNELELPTKMVHEREGRFMCDICNQSYSRICNLKRHMKLIHERQREYMCDICDQLFFRIENFKMHMKKVHKILDIHYTDDVSNINEENIIDVRQQNKEYECVFCHKVFTQSGSLSIHINSYSYHII